MKHLLISLLFTPFFSFSQSYLDKKIVINYTDTIGLYEKIKLNFVKENYIVKEDKNSDTLTSYPKEKSPLGYIIIRAAIKGNKVTYWGFYSKRKINWVGYTLMPEDYKPILYYGHNAGTGWKELSSVAK